MEQDNFWTNIWTGIGAVAASLAGFFGINRARPSLESRIMKRLEPKFTALEEKIDATQADVAFLKGRFTERDVQNRSRGRT